MCRCSACASARTARRRRRDVPGRRRRCSRWQRSAGAAPAAAACVSATTSSRLSIRRLRRGDRRRAVPRRVRLRGRRDLRAGLRRGASRLRAAGDHRRHGHQVQLQPGARAVLLDGRGVRGRLSVCGSGWTAQIEKKALASMTTAITTALTRRQDAAHSRSDRLPSFGPRARMVRTQKVEQLDHQNLPPGGRLAPWRANQ